MVAGLAALLIDKSPSAPIADVRDAIINTGDISSFGSVVQCGRVNAARAMTALVNNAIPRTCNGVATPGPAPAPVRTPDAPTSPGCWVFTPSGCPNQASY